VSDPRLPVEVDPWSDGHWSRVERDMFEQLDTPGAGAQASERGRTLRRRLLVGGTLAAAAAMALVFLLRPSGILRSSDRLRVATTDGASEVTVGESSLVVAPRSLVLVSGDDDHGIDVVLDRGAVTCEVAPRRGRPPFVVDAGDVRVRVVGTRFTVTRDALATSVAVDHGVVEVIEGGKVTALHDGERWPAPDRSPANPGAPEPGAVDPDAPAAPMRRGPGAPSTPDTRPATSVDSPAPGRSRQAAPPGSASAPGRPAPQDVGSSHDEAMMTAAVPESASPSPQEAYESAARLEKLRPDDAAGIYRRLAAGSTAWAPSALFALARLDADRGERQEAARLLRDYLSRYPRGINADDARVLLQRMQ
jgi:hypothetical protein